MNNSKIIKLTDSCVYLGILLLGILLLQKKAVRIIDFRPYISHSTPIFKYLKILKLEDLYTMQLYKFY